ncbi:SubName: Full=Uncharacterized protein {ECO:0000313/EMBL:CCA72810.1} [Serendipita indica DSM 11827]|nr:SubName: Full=Uncharacterized protein {ECO:0000313/EMBL:CCA72810.1} [Serendipita indica DSM 11827]
MAFQDDDEPGGSGFIDVAPVFLEAAADIGEESMISIENFTLHDAMMAIEIMDPRMDSGIERDAYPRQRFDPYQALLPEEVCWIIDRMFAAETAWHTGHSLAQTVYTCLYVHELGVGRLWNGNRINTRILQIPQDPSRPLQLVTLVLRASVYGILKTCDLAWREMTRGHILEMEDFNGDKSERYLCETISASEIIGMLDAARTWLLSRQCTITTWRTELLARIDLRRMMLLLLSSSLPSEAAHYKATIRQAQEYLTVIKQFNEPPIPHKGSTALKSFDPIIARRLISIMPPKIVELPNHHQTWEQYSLFIDGLREVALLSTCPSFSGIQELLDLRTSQPPRPNRWAFVRSFSCTSIHNARGDLWANEMFAMLADLKLETAINNLPVSPIDHTSLPYFHIAIPKMIKEYMASFFCNRPRQRRRLCNWMSDWSALVPYLYELVIDVPPIDVRRREELERLIVSLQIVRLLGACHIVLSGLELGVYSDVELPFALWYGSTLFAELSRDVAQLEGRKASDAVHLDDSVPAVIWLPIMAKFFQATSQAAILVGRKDIAAQSPVREEATMKRRYKWAFTVPRLIDLGTGPLPAPNRAFHPSPTIVDPCVPEWEQWVKFKSDLGEDAALQLSDAFSNLHDQLQKIEGVLAKLKQGYADQQPIDAVKVPRDRPARPPHQRSLSSMLRDFLPGGLGSQEDSGTEPIVKIVSNSLKLELVSEMRSVASINVATFSKLSTPDERQEPRVSTDGVIGTSMPSIAGRTRLEDGSGAHSSVLLDTDPMSLVATGEGQANFQTTPDGAEHNAPPRLCGRPSGLSPISISCETSPSRWFPAFVCHQRLSAVPVSGVTPVA